MTACHPGVWTLAEPPETDQPAPAADCLCGRQQTGWFADADHSGWLRDQRQEQFDERDRVP